METCHVAIMSPYCDCVDWSAAARNCLSYFKSWVVANGNASPLTLAAK